MIFKITLAGVALVVATFIGATIGTQYRELIRAQDSAPSPTPSTKQELKTDPKVGGHVGANGVTETLLTGEAETKARAAANTAVDGGTILRVETDAEGSPYEAHMRKADGSEVTVKFDNEFMVTKIEEGKR